MASNPQQIQCSMSSPYPLVWFEILDAATGLPYNGTSVSSILRSSLVVPVIAQFRDAVKAKYDQSNYLKDIPSGTLIVFKNKAGFDKRNAPADEGNEEPLKSSCLLDDLGITKEDVLIVAVPSSRSLKRSSSESNITGKEPNPERK